MRMKRFGKKIVTALLAAIFAVGTPGSAVFGNLVTVKAEDTWVEVTGKITNGDFESDLNTGWENNIEWDNVWSDGGATWTKAQNGTNNDTQVFHYSAQNDAKVEIYQTIAGLDVGTYKVELEYAG